MKTVVVLSGGQDSTTCLYWARKLGGGDVYAITFDYGQRHAAEIQAAIEIAKEAGVVMHRVVDMKGYGSLAKSALTEQSVDVKPDGGLHNLPSTFTPGRNLVFLTVAASWAISLGAQDIVTGVCQTDYSGYPDCRRNTIDALETAIKLGNDLDIFHIHTPLMSLTKKETVELARDLGCLDAMKKTITCYHGKRPGCGECPACALRKKGFEEAGIADPAAA